jgi:ppGpp synthetase/RelA/SpoT-type nucleotidyltranferase
MPTSRAPLTAKEKQYVRKLVAHFAENQHLFEIMLDQVKGAIHGSKGLMQEVHSTKWRVKDPTHLNDKLLRKMGDAKKAGRKFPYGFTEKNLFSKVNDLAGFRILHLHTQQIVQIDTALRSVFDEYRYDIVEGPQARTWDDESREFFRQAGITTIKSPKMYTSVHYIIRTNSRTSVTCEIQVRTLAEELWGEVDHALNYPHESESLACREQIKVLARITSSCSRLVDSIFTTARNQEP